MKLHIERSTKEKKISTGVFSSEERNVYITIFRLEVTDEEKALMEKHQFREFHDSTFTDKETGRQTDYTKPYDELIQGIEEHHENSQTILAIEKTEQKYIDIVQALKNSLPLLEMFAKEEGAVVDF